MHLIVFWECCQYGFLLPFTLLMLRPFIPHWRLSSVLINCLHHCFLYGKAKNEAELRQVQKIMNPKMAAAGAGSKLNLFSLPKRWYVHFYLVGAIAHSLVLCMAIFILVFHQTPWLLQQFILWNDAGYRLVPRGGTKSAWPLLLVLTLSQLHLLRRLYECLYVSTFSDTTMSIVHYLYGMMLNTTFGLGLLAYARAESLTLSPPASNIQMLLMAKGVLMFAYGSYHQHDSLVTLANLRKRTKKNKNKEPVGHFVPYGGLFEYVSCPHHFCEVLIFVSYNFMYCFTNLYLLYMAMSVVYYQLCLAMTTHVWYMGKFYYYPPNRKCIIPFIC